MAYFGVFQEYTALGLTCENFAALINPCLDPGSSSIKAVFFFLGPRASQSHH